MTSAAAQGPAAGSAQSAALTLLDLRESAAKAAARLKAMAHGGRMMILCHQAIGEKTVSELEQRLDQRQAAVSRQLRRLRGDGVVSCRRAGKACQCSL